MSDVKQNSRRLGKTMSNEYHVSCNGHDNAAGTMRDPFRTVQRAADFMQPGDGCVVHGGTYREWIRPPRGGSGPDAYITYRAAPGEKVVVKGSERISCWSRLDNGLWRAELPDGFFGEFNPYRTRVSGGWLTYGMEYHLGAVYLDGEPLREKFSLDEVAAAPCTYLIEHSSSSTILTANFDGSDPNAALAEINVRECAFFPLVKGLGYVAIDGFEFRHGAANWACFRSFQRGLVGTYYGHCWLIRNCRIADARCAGLVCGNDPSSENDSFDVGDVGKHIVRNNHIFRCGEAGIHGFKGWAGSLIEGNLIEDINQHDEFGGFETAGLKIHDGVDLTVKGNVIRRVRAGRAGRKGEFAGLWIDWGAQGARVSGNVVYDMDAWPLYLQNSHACPILVDHNIIEGSVVHSSGGTVFAHNLFISCHWTHQAEEIDSVVWKPHTGEAVKVIPMRQSDDAYFNNMFIGCGADSFPKLPGYRCDWNVFCGGARPSVWGDEHSSIDPSGECHARILSLEHGVEIVIHAGPVQAKGRGPLVTGGLVGVFPLTGQGIEHADGTPVVLGKDIFDQPRPDEDVRQGPFQKLKEGAQVFRIYAGP